MAGPSGLRRAKRVQRRIKDLSCQTLVMERLRPVVLGHRLRVRCVQATSVWPRVITRLPDSPTIARSTGAPRG